MINKHSPHSKSAFFLAVCLIITLTNVSCRAPDVKTSFITTIKPFSLILKEVIGDSTRIKTLLSSSASAHTYEPRPDDVRKVSQATALFFASHNLDGWALSLHSKRSIELTKLLPDSAILTFTESAKGIDPHFWMDPLTVKAMIPGLVDTICTLDKDGCHTYSQNASRFAKQLDSLNQVIMNSTEEFSNLRIMLSEPFLVYYTRRYSISIDGLIEPIPGKEPTPMDLERLVTTARTKKTSFVVAQVQLPIRSSRAVSEAARIPLVVLDPIGSSPGINSYADLLIYNTALLNRALN